MPNIYNNFCYSTLAEAAVAELSQPARAHATGISHAETYAVTTTANTVNITYRYKPFSTAAATVYVVPKTYPTCTQVGYLTNFTGMNLPDVVKVSWLVVLVWAVAWGLKRVSRML